MSPVPPARSSSVRRGRGIERGDEDPLPGPVDAERHQVVHQVVARRHAVEHGAHHAGFFAARGTAEAEIGGLGRSWGCRLMPRPRYSRASATHAGTPRSRDRDARPAGAAARAARSCAPRSIVPTCAGRFRRPGQRLTGAGSRLPPAGEIHPDAAGRRRSRADPSRHVRPHD